MFTRSICFSSAATRVSNALTCARTAAAQTAARPLAQPLVTRQFSARANPQGPKTVVDVVVGLGLCGMSVATTMSLCVLNQLWIAQPASASEDQPRR